MHRRFPGRRFHAVVLAIAILELAPAAALAGSHWTYGLAAAASLEYPYRVEPNPGSRPASLSPGLILGASGTRDLTRHASLVLEGGYREYGTTLGLVGIPESPPTSGSLRAQYFSLGAGLRIRPFSDAARATGPYLQVVPAFFFSRWEESTVDHEGWDMMTGAWRPRTTHTDAFRSAMPGIEMSAGMHARITDVIGTDVAVRLTQSADLGEHDLGRFSSGDFRGLDEIAVVGGFTWSP